MKPYKQSTNICEITEHTFDSQLRLDKKKTIRDSDGKEPTCNAGDSGLIPESESSPEGGPGDLLQYCCLGNSMDRGAWQAYSPPGHKELDMTERLRQQQR